MEQQTPTQLKKSPIGQWIALLIIIIVIGGLVAFILSKKTDEISEDLSPKTEESKQLPAQTPIPIPTTPSAPVSSTPTPVSSTPTTQKSTYKDGTYRADGQYIAPSGSESIDVKITVVKDVVTDVQTSANAQNGTSFRFQQRFAQSVGSYVIGKKLDQIQLDAVSGASLTTNGFMNALQKIQTDARV